MTNANGSATATVETLTAEVRVLQVGNRQITLSVARQLDHIPLPRLEVFGRIKLGNGYTGSYVIGRDLADGTLAVASYGHYAKTRDWRVELEVDPGLPKPALGWNVKSLRTHEVTIDGIPCTIRVSDCVRQGRTGDGVVYESREIEGQYDGFIPVPDNGGDAFIPGPQLEGFALQAHDALNVANAQHQMYLEAHKAPLIVLAGLK